MTFCTRFFSAFGPRAQAVPTGEFGWGDTFAASDIISNTTAEILAVGDVAAITLPAGGALLISGLALFAARRRIVR